MLKSFKQRMTRIKFFLIIIPFTLLFLFYKAGSAQAQTSLSFQPASSTRQAGDTFALEIRIDTLEKIFGADIDFSYDPTILTVQKISPGNFFSNPQILTNQIDSEKGFCSLSIFAYPGQEGNAVVATVLLTAVNPTTQSAQIKFEPSTILATVGERKILFSTTPATIAVSPKINTGVTSPAVPFSPPTAGVFATLPPLSSPTPLPAKPTFITTLIKSLGGLLIIGGVLLLVFVLVIL